MIINLSGKITHKAADWVVVEAAGVGYRVFVTPALNETLKVGTVAKLWTHEHQRDDGRELYGFGSMNELDLFKKLVDISGVGPRLALNVLALGSVKEIERAIEKGDVDLLSRVPRIGRKTAQKIILELRGKLVDGGRDGDEVLAALIGLGYDREAAREALRQPSVKETSTVEAQLKAALKELGRRQSR
ncbi:MAG: Holliday junction branch migration protein RuvA [Patescibacteria group bacterium]|nr:Holliday junction branch migration protein RuvA [Patescibacteria group bacterium]